MSLHMSCQKTWKKESEMQLLAIALASVLILPLLTTTPLEAKCHYGFKDTHTRVQVQSERFKEQGGKYPTRDEYGYQPHRQWLDCGLPNDGD